MLKKGILYVCATPIGNLGDITLRTLDTLRGVELIAAEDTRHSRKLLAHYDIHVPLISYHEHNEKGRAQEILDKLKKGVAIALITDAGMPGISDPGHTVIKLCRDNGVPVDVLPGPNAALTALVLSGLPTERFAFLGFCQGSKAQRHRQLAEYAQLTMTQVFYEAPHRLPAMLGEMAAIYGERQAVVVREISKLHQQVHEGSLPDLATEFAAKPARGECCIVVAPYIPKLPAGGPAQWLLVYEERLQAGLSPQAAMKETALEFGVSKRDIYRVVLEKKEGS
jgi:16S rRNA (cytidine1402-2'-O)-methyltransferase